MSLIVLVLVVVACMVMSTYQYWQREAEPSGEKKPQRSFLLWVGRGLVGPLLIWTFFNCGLLVGPLFPKIGQAYAAGTWAKAFFPITAGALFIIGSWWSAVTLAWIAWRTIQRSENRRETLITAGIWLSVAVPISALIAAALGHIGSGFAAALCFGAVAHAALPINAPKIGPTYSKALAKIAFDKFNEAEWEIIQELERQGNDYDGWLLLAELYATHFHDLQSAERTVCELCDDPATTPPQVAIALNRLADWHLKLASNPQHARWALEQICERLPNTHMARMAQLRISTLPSSGEELARQREPRRIKLPTFATPLPAPPDSAVSPIAESEAPKIRLPDSSTQPSARETARAEAQQCAEALNTNPNDIETRLRFARIMADKLGKADIGVEQVELLLQITGATDGQRQEWLAMLAEWHLNLRQDPEMAKLTLERIVREYPQTHAAFEAQRRLYVLGLEAAARQRRKAATTLGP